MNRRVLDDLKQQISLLDYLQAHDWQPVRRLSRGRLMGLCPLHAEHRPSFLVDPSKNLFYCYGCGRGGDVIRFAELFHQVKFPQALAWLRQWRGLPPILQETAEFYRMQLHRHGEPSPTCTNAASARRNSSSTCASAMLPVVACEVG